MAYNRCDKCNGAFTTETKSCPWCSLPLSGPYEQATKSPPPPSFYCKNCGSVGSGVNSVRGSGPLEVVLWLGLFLALVIPWPLAIGYAFIPICYSVWRHSAAPSLCAICGCDSLIPVDSPIAQRALAEAQQPTAQPPGATQGTL